MAKINLKRGLTDIVLYLIIFIVVQIIVMYAGVGIGRALRAKVTRQRSWLSVRAAILS